MSRIPFHVSLLLTVLMPFHATLSQARPMLSIVIETSSTVPSDRSTIVELKKGSGGFANSILVNEAIATAEDLSAAMMAIRHMRAKYGDALQSDMRLVAPRTDANKSSSAKSARGGSVADGQLRMLKKARPAKSLLHGKTELVKRIIVDTDPLLTPLKEHSGKD